MTRRGGRGANDGDDCPCGVDCAFCSVLCCKPNAIICAFGLSRSGAVISQVASVGTHTHTTEAAVLPLTNARHTSPRRASFHTRTQATPAEACLCHRCAWSDQPNLRACVVSIDLAVVTRQSQHEEQGTGNGRKHRDPRGEGGTAGAPRYHARADACLGPRGRGCFRG